MIHTIEECAQNAWPALHQLHYDGWVLRFAKGYTKRANSVNVFHTSRLNVSQKIQRCIELYQQQSLPATFRVTPLAQAEKLDDVLATSGFSKQSPTRVMALALASIHPELSPAFTYWPNYDPGWEAAFIRFNGVPAQRETHQMMLQHILPQSCFAAIIHNDEIVACGLGVLERGQVGLFDIVTNPTVRRQGFGYQLVVNILHWAKTRGATKAYLQVEQRNIPAINLYTKLGFEDIYQYWYRIQS